MKRTVLVLTFVATAALSGCVQARDGVAVRASDTDTTTTTRSSATSARPPSSTAPSVYGVTPTLREPIPPNAFLCFPSPTDGGTTSIAEVTDPVAPRIVVSVPRDWTATPGQGDVALNLAGPEGMSGTVTIAPTTLDAADAFDQYGDDATAAAPISTVSALPAEFCGYSSQRLMGTWADNPGQTVEFVDRITHIWTNTTDYLVTIHAQAPAGAAGFESAESVLMEDFAIVIP